MHHTPKRKFDTLRAQEIALARLAEFENAEADADKASVLASIIYETFNDYYVRSRKIPWLVKQAFETRDWPASIALSQERIGIFSDSVFKTVEVLKQAIQEMDSRAGFWDKVEISFRLLVAGNYETDLALAYLSAIRRVVYQNRWVPVDYERGTMGHAKNQFLEFFEIDGKATADLVKKIFSVPDIDAPFKDMDKDAERVAERINEELEITAEKQLTHAEVVKAGFYRNRGAYIVGALTVSGKKTPFAFALLNKANGVEVDAVILRETTLRHVFSSTLANLHVTIDEYHELVDYLYSLMPTRPRGMHYSTIGYNHLGKLAVMDQITVGLTKTGEVMDWAPGPRGSVSLAFTAPSMGYVLKVIRDNPTDQYKWYNWDGPETVINKYRKVHDLNRSGSMLDNIIFWNLVLPKKMFSENVLAELLEEASGSVSLYRNGVFFKHLIIQRKLIPVPLYLQNCSPREAEMVVIRLGQCIRNNAAANVFNKDLDGRNYGVSSLRFVYLFDYDAVEPLTDIKIRTNVDREDGEEDLPEWVFEEGDIFLPEELEVHLRLPDRNLKRLFREAHGELLTTDYWQKMQQRLEEGLVPRVRTYPRSCQLDINDSDGNMVLSSPSDIS